MLHYFTPFNAGGEAESAATTFGIALISFFSQDRVLFILGALLALVRIAYEAARLWKFLTNRQEKDNEDNG